MPTKRIISRIDIKGDDIVKGVNLEGLRVLGNPEKFSLKYYQDGIDEIFIQDVVASLYGRNSLHEVVTKIAENVFVPITVGGGIRNLNDINQILRAGADKVSINSAAVLDPLFIKDAVTNFGSSTITISIETNKDINGNFSIFYENGREESGIELIEWIKKIQDLGAGEIFLTSIENEGTGHGYQTEILDKIQNYVDIPLIIYGGAKNKHDVLKVLRDYNLVDGACMSSMLHYSYLANEEISNFNNIQGNLEFLKNKNDTSKNKFEKINIYDLKKFLYTHQIDVRF